VLTSSSVKPAVALVTFEVLSLLVGNENLKIIEVALAVEAPRPLELLVEIGVPLPLLCHGGGCSEWMEWGRSWVRAGLTTLTSELDVSSTRAASLASWRRPRSFLRT